MGRLLRLALAICAPLMLTSCLVTPGKFTSTLDIRADRSFTFTYQGEVLALDTGESAETGSGDSKPPVGKTTASQFLFASSDATAAPRRVAAAPKPAAPKPAAPKKESPENAAKMREMAESLTKELGYRSVKYVGDNVFMIDYRISGRLDHGFVWPFNPDASIIVPMVAIELRGADRVRVKASGYANNNDSVASLGVPPGMAGGDADKAAARLDGRFTLTTDAEIVSQNQEEGVTNVPGGKSVTWKVTPKTDTPPMAVLKLKALP